MVRTWLQKDISAHGFTLSHMQKALFGALGQFVVLVQPVSCLPPPDVLLGGARNHLAHPPLPMQPCWIWWPHLQMCNATELCKNYFHLPLFLDQNARSKCASTCITNVQGNGGEIICSLEKKSEEILFLTSWVLQNISPLTPCRRSCAGRAFWCCFQSVCQVFGIYQRRRGLSLAEHSRAMVPGVHSSTAYARPEDADPAVCSHDTETFSCWQRASSSLLLPLVSFSKSFCMITGKKCEIRKLPDTPQLTD